MRPDRLSLFAFVLALLAACDGEDGETPAQRYCAAVEIQTSSCSTPSPCDQAIVADCGSVTALLNDAYVDASASCVEAGGTGLDCLIESRASVSASAAHQAFASAFCENCAFGVSGCEEALFDSEESDYAVAGAIILPLGDSLVRKLQEECTSGFTCLGSFPSCAQKVLAEEAVPTETIECLVDGFISGETEPAACGTTE